MSKVLIYQMYPASWGGFREMAKHLPIVKSLMVDYVWLNPCFESPWVDGGYDISDYQKVNPRFGTMEDFDFFVAEANKLGIEVLLDLVANHTSTEHEWFKRSLQNDPEYRNYYIWSKRDLGWGNNFDGGPAFKYCPECKKYYLHLFNEKQADLNWRNPKVIQEFQKIIDFWTLKHGVAGFRLDVAQYIGKDINKAILPREIFGVHAGFARYYQKPLMIKTFYRLFGRRNLFVFSESSFISKRRMRKLAGKNGPLTGALNIIVSEAPKRLGKKLALPILKAGIRRWQSEPEFILSTENHDGPRYTSAIGQDGKTILKAMFESKCEMICLYQGQELGLKNPNLGNNIHDYQDIQTIMRYEKMLAKGKTPSQAIKRLKSTSRDNTRYPIDLKEYQKQDSINSSCLNTARRLIAKWKNQ